MFKYFLVLTIFTIFALFSYFYLGFSESLFKGPKFDALSETAQKKLVSTFKFFFKALAIGILFTTVVPLLRDLPSVTEKKVELVEGVVQSVSRGPFGFPARQELLLGETTVELYFDTPVLERRQYRIWYLPNSHLGIKAELIEN